MFVILFGSGIVTEWRVISEIFELFCRASGMEIKLDKTCVLCVDESSEQTEQISEIFLVNSFPLNLGFKYLGYMLKTNCYRISNWHWLIKKVENRITNWSHKWLTLGGRVTLINSVLNSIPIYWFSLGQIPISIMINSLRKLIVRFLWSGTGSVDKIHLIKWDMIFIPRAGGGWVIRNPLSSNIALSLKCGWKAINN